MADLGWVSVHAYYHGDVDRLLLDAVRPVVRRLEDQHAISRWFFLRYWQGGPHVRLRLLPDAAVASAVHSQAAQALAAWMAQHPAPDTLDAGTYRRFAERQAALEGTTDGGELRPNNTVETHAYTREHDVFGTDGALDAAEQHFHTSSEIAMAVLGAPGGRAQRVGSAVSVLALTMAMCDLEPAHLAQWLSDTWRDWWRSGPRAANAAAIAFDSDPDDRMVARVRALWERARVAPAADGDGAVDRWLRSLRSLRSQLLAAPTKAAAVSPMVPTGAAGPGHAGTAIPALLRCAHLYNNRIGLGGPAEGRIFALVTAALHDGDGEVAP